MTEKQYTDLVYTAKNNVLARGDGRALDCIDNVIIGISTAAQLDFIRYVLTNNRFIYEEAREILECMTETMLSEFESIVESMAFHCLALIVVDDIKE